MKIKNNIKIAATLIVALNSVTFLAEANENLISTAQLDNNISKPSNDFSHYSFPISAKTELNPIHQAPNTSSDEYWFQVTGSELNKGVTVNTTQPDAVIRITQGRSKSAQKRASDLDTSLLKLSSVLSPQNSAIGQIISKKQLADIGVFDNTVVLKTESKIAAGALQLRSSQSLNSDDTYMISVKEKGSKYRLNLSMPAQSYTENDLVRASAKILSGDTILKPDNLKATLVAPDGKQSPVKFSIDKQGSISLKLIHPKHIIAPIKGLYEIKLEASGMENNLRVQRNAKLALAFTNNSARLAKVSLDPQAAFASLNVLVKQNSRFEVRGVLFGTNYDGELVPVMETHAAKTLPVGINKLRLPFDIKILSASNVSPPFELRSVRLFDQGQLGLVDSLATNVKAL